MRILIVHDYGVAVGGAEKLSVALRDGLRARGHQSRLFASSARPLPLETVSDVTCFGSSGPLRRILQVANPDAVRSLRRTLTRFRPDVVHVRMFLTQLSPLILPLLRDVPTLLHVINYNLICPLNTKTLPDGSPCRFAQGAVCHRTGCVSWLGVARVKAQERLLDLSVFDRVIANSRWVSDRLEAEGIRVDGHVWNGVPVVPARPPLPPGPPLIAFAGRLAAKKGVDVLLEAAKNVVDELPTARLLIAGDGPERGALERQVERLGLEERVRMAGHLLPERLEAEFAGAWVQVVPSLWEEPFGIVAAEAMMRGTAAVVTGPGGLAEQVIDGETGFVVPAGDADALARALLRICRDRDLAERLGRAGRSRALAFFRQERFVDAFEGQYRALLRDRLSGRSPAPPNRSA